MKTQFIKPIAVTAAIALGWVVNAAPPGTGWKKVFSDEFNDWKVDTTKWDVKEKKDYTKSGNTSWFYKNNVHENGKELVITNKWLSTPGPNGEVYSGGWVESKKQFNKGYYEAKVRSEWDSPKCWSTFWLWKWGQTHNNEFDIMEYNHWTPYPSQSHHYPNGHITQNTVTKASDYHVWGLLWTDTKAVFYIDGVKQFESDKPWEARSAWLPMILSSSPNRDSQPARSGAYPRFYVDWVRVWQGGNAGAIPEPPYGKIIALKAKGNNRYVSANKNISSTTWPLVANQPTVAGSWEKFYVENAGSGRFALKSIGSGKYVTSDKNLSATHWPLMAGRSSGINTWEKFLWLPNADGTISIRALGNAKYICSDGGLNNVNWPINANRTSVGGAWEKFTYEIK